MMRFLVAVISVFLPCFALASDVNVSNSLNKSFIKYEEKYNSCIERAKESQVSSDVVEQIRALDLDLSVSIGYLYSQSLYKCSLNELSALMRLILLIDKSDPDSHQMAHSKVQKIKKLLFSPVDFRLESKFQSLPEDKKDLLLDIVDQIEPFNMIELYDNIQSN